MGRKKTASEKDAHHQLQMMLRKQQAMESVFANYRQCMKSILLNADEKKLFRKMATVKSKGKK